MKWRPIKTAPKDGTPVLLAGGADWDADQYGDSYSEDELEKMASPCRAWWDGESASDPAGFWLITHYDSCCSLSRENPTHWMPLPTPPARGRV